MTVYNTGTVTINVGSSSVRGNGTTTNWLTNVEAGNLFKINGENTWYTVAGIQTATRLSLSSRYSSTDDQTAESELLASLTTASRTHTGTLDETPAVTDTIYVIASLSSSTKETFSDDGAGVLTGDASPVGSGTVDYDTGAVSITVATMFSTYPSEALGTTNIATSYYTGTLLSTPLAPNQFNMYASDLTYSDDGSSNIITSEATDVGDINYTTGNWSLNMTATYSSSALITATYLTTLNATYNITASYYSGDTRNALAYQIVTDYTTNYSFPEMSLNDTNFPNIYTRAIRSIDSNMNVLVASSITATILSVVTFNVAALTATTLTVTATTDYGVSHIATLTTNNLTATTADINGGTINNTTIGMTTTASGDFTTLHGDTLNASLFTATTITDGTTTITGGNLSGATEVSATTLTDGTVSITGGIISAVATLTATIGHIVTFTASDLTASTVNIEAGTIDNTTVGVTTQTTGDFTTLHGDTLSASDFTATVGRVITFTASTLAATNITDNTLTITGGNLSGATEVSATTITDGTVSITGGNLYGATEVSATTITDGTTTMTGGVISGGTSVKCTSYINIGTKYIFAGDITPVAASIQAAASSVVTEASLNGALYMNSTQLWYFTADNTATTIALN